MRPPEVDVYLKPILRRHLRDADWERDRYLWVRIGYQLLGSLDDREDGFTEHRGILEVTARVPLPSDVWNCATWTATSRRAFATGWESSGSSRWAG